MAKKETGAAKAATIKPFVLKIEGDVATVHPAGGVEITVKMTDDLRANFIRLGMSTALKNTYADALKMGWDSVGEKGAQAGKLATHWAESGVFSRERAAAETKAEMASRMIAELSAKIDAMDVPAETKAVLKAQLAA
jgi:hypothetical protein